MTSSARILTAQPNSSPRLLRPAAPRQAYGVIDEIRLALRPRSRAAFVTGLLLGAVVPGMTFVEAHREIDWQRPLWGQPSVLFVLGGLLFSAFTLWHWGKQAFSSRVKATGFVVLLEGVMVTSHTPWLALLALGYLIAINGIATACNLARPGTP